MGQLVFQLDHMSSTSLILLRKIIPKMPWLLIHKPPGSIQVMRFKVLIIGECMRGVLRVLTSHCKMRLQTKLQTLTTPEMHTESFKPKPRHSTVSSRGSGGARATLRRRGASAGLSRGRGRSCRVGAPAAPAAAPPWADPGVHGVFAEYRIPQKPRIEA